MEREIIDWLFVWVVDGRSGSYRVRNDHSNPSWGCSPLCIWIVNRLIFLGPHMEWVPPISFGRVDLCIWTLSIPFFVEEEWRSSYTLDSESIWLSNAFVCVHQSVDWLDDISTISVVEHYDWRMENNFLSCLIILYISLCNDCDVH